jgi:flagellar hook-basal body complex protein FliE
MSGFDLQGLDGPRTPVTLGGGIGDRARPTDATPRAGESFRRSLASALEELSSLQHDVKDKAEALARGEPVELHELMIAMGKSDVAFSLMLEVRNKLVDAWMTLSRTAV